MKKWNIIKHYSTELDVVASILENRGLSTKEKINEFLNPPTLQSYIAAMPNDFKTSLKLSRDIVFKALEDSAPILIYGDYDSDGVSATALLYSTLTKTLGYSKCSYFIPNRFEHGYGLSVKAFDEAFNDLKESFGESPYYLLITVDTGITAVEEIAHAKKNNFKTIITDHHQKPNPLPEADVIVWSGETVGCGLSWILCTALGLKDLSGIDLVALATVTDLQALVGFSRTAVIKGLESMNNKPRVGIKKLLDIAGKSKQITVYDLGWVIGPRINALGRMDHAIKGVELLTTEDEEKAVEIASLLQDTNLLRQDETEKMYDLAQVETKPEDKIIISVNQEYHEGIIGLVASKLVQKYYKPVIVISHDGTVGKGSVRSIPGINIIEILRQFESDFEKLGGHPMAAGFSIKVANIKTLETKLVEYMNTHYTEADFVPFIDVDVEIPISLVTLDLYTQVSKLMPYGNGNPEPVFCVRDLKVTAANTVGRDLKHVSFAFLADGKIYKGIYFNAPADVLTVKPGSLIDVVFCLSRNDYNQKTSIDLLIKDILLK